MTLVSIVIAAYNCEGYLAQTLQSACSQTLQDFEVIVIDDGSKDGTRAVAESFPDRRVRVFSQANQGQCAASNAGCRYARGRYLKFLDADAHILLAVVQKLVGQSVLDAAVKP